MKLIKMRRTGYLKQVSDKTARLYVDLLHVAVYLEPVVKKPAPIQKEPEPEETKKPKRTYRRRDMTAEDAEKPKKRQYRRRNMKAEEESC